MKNIITLTTIPSRFEGVVETLNSLHQQSADIEKIILYIPEQYKRKEFNNYSLPAFPDWFEVRVTKFDYGPASKVLHAVEEFRDCDVRLIYCDDDRIYDPDWAQRLIDRSDELPDHCIAARGIGLPELYDGINRRANKGSLYRLKRLFSLGLWKPRVETFNDRVDFAIGFAGVLVKPSFFTDDVFDIPGILWLQDDVWLSGFLRINGIEIASLEDGAKMSKQNKANSMDELRTFVFEGVDRTGLNLSGVKFFQDKYGIWNDSGATLSI